MAPAPFVEPTPFYSVKPHGPNSCRGDCHVHPLVVGPVAEMVRWMADGFTWGDIVYYDELKAESAMTDKEKAEREAQRAAAAKERELAEQASTMFRYAEAQKGRNTVCKGKQRHIVKRAEPCRWLYADEAAPKKDGKAPIRNYTTGAYCWAYEYYDPRTGEHKTPHTCGYLHPGEAGWLAEWEKDRHFRPGQGRFAPLGR
jgi:hypothetical protein